MKNEPTQSRLSIKRLAAVCGLYCGACSLYIATTENPERLGRLATQFKLSEESIKCYGCRSDKRFPPCDKCIMSTCAAEKKIDFCSECSKYPCEDLKKFHSAMPHRIELWDDLQFIKNAGYEQWLKKIPLHYACSHCQTINSAYDLKCRKCGNDPSCDYVCKHKIAIERHLSNAR